NERNYDSAPGKPLSLEAPISREDRHGVSHIRRVCHLHHFRCVLSLLCGEKPFRTDSARSPGNADLLYDLFVVQQSDDPLCGKTSGTQKAQRISALLVAHDRSWRPLSVRHGPGMAPLDLRTRADYFHESLWNDVLLARWPARLSRCRWTDHVERRAFLRIGGARWTGALCSRQCAFLVLAFRRFRVGHCVHPCLRSRPLRRRNGNAVIRGAIRAEPPGPS